MKKILLLSAVLLGTVSASQAGVSIRIGIPFPTAVVVGAPAPVYVQPAPVYVQPAPVYYAPAPVVVAPAPVCPVVTTAPVVSFNFGWGGGGHYVRSGGYGWGHAYGNGWGHYGGYYRR